jgi:hypothetical protein
MPKVKAKASEADWDVTPAPVATEEPTTVTDVTDEVAVWDSAPEVYSQLVIETHSGEFDPDHTKILIYGESGTGKTRFASTFPNVIFADIDKGMSSVTEQVARVDINNLKDMKALHAFLQGSEHDYETVVIDTLNEMQRVAMQATVEDFPMIRRSYEDLPSMSDYGKMLHDFIEMTRKFILLPMRVVLLGQVITRQFETDVLQPQLVGKNSAREVARKMDVIGYIYKGEKEDENHKKLSEISFDATEFVTKDRSFRLPAMLVEPTYQRMADYWK